MTHHLPLRLKAAAVAGALAVAFVVPATAAWADTAPPVSGTPVTVSSDSLPTVQIGDGVVWAQVVVGDTVFVGGSFSTARPANAAPGSQTVPRSNFLAYNIKTGALLPFAPVFNAQVRALAASPDGKTLYVGGQFDQVNGAGRFRIAAFDIATGALKTSFTAGTNSTVTGIAATESKVYLTGNFSSVNKGPDSTRLNAAAVNASNGTLLDFKVTPAGGSVQRVVVSPDRTKVVLGGNFTSLNGSNRPGYGMALVDAVTGAQKPMSVNSLIRNAGIDAAITSLAPAADGFYGTGYRFGNGTGNLEGSFKADWNGTLIWIEDCHGDSYSVAPTATELYLAGHPHDCSNIGGFPDTQDPVQYHRALAITLNKTRTVTGRVPDYYDFRGQPAPTVLNWYPDLNVGTFTGQAQGPWSVAANASYVVYSGEFTRVNNKGQQGLVRFARPSIAPNLDGPRESGTGFNLAVTSSALSGTTARWRANWDRDNTRLTYKLLRDGAVVHTVTNDSTFWQRTTLSYTDRSATRGRTYTYQVSATDPFGNTQSSSSVRVTIR